MTLTIRDLKPGSIGKIKSLSRIGDVNFETRLQEMGITLGTTVEVAYLGPLGGTIALRVRSTIVAIRSEDAFKIEVESV